MSDLEIITLPVGQMKANCYLVINKKTWEALIIDPGDDAEYIENKLRDKNCTPVVIICTHGHFDHTGAVLELELTYNIPFLINKKDEFLLEKNQESAKHFTGIDIGPKPKITEIATEGKNIKIGNTNFIIIETPGHTPGSICLYHTKDNILFAGDLLFADGRVGRTDFSYSDKNALLQSIAKIKKLPPETLVYPGHGDSFMISDFNADL